MQVIIQLLRHEIKNKITHRRPLRGYIFGTQLCLRLRLEHRFLYFYADRRNNRSTNIGQIKIFLVKITDCFHHSFPKSDQVRSPLRRVLTVHERVILFPVLPPVRHRHLNIIPPQMNDRVQPLSTHILRQQVIQPSLGMQFLTVKIDGQPGIQEHVVLEHGLQVIHDIMVVTKQLLVCDKSHQRTIRFRGRYHLLIFHDQRFIESHPLRLPVPEGLDNETLGKSIHGFYTDTVQSYGFLKSFRIILGPRVHLRGHVNQFTQWNSSSEIPYRNRPFLHVDNNLASRSHREFVDTIIHHLFNQYVYSIVHCRSVPQFSDIHTGAQAYMFPPVQRPNRIFRIVLYHKLSMFCTKIIKTPQFKI